MLLLQGLTLLLLADRSFGQAARPKLFVVGGGGVQLGTQLTEIIDPSGMNSNAYQPTANYPYPPFGPVATYINKKVMVCGGEDNNSNYNSGCYNYDLDAKVWSVTTSMNVKRTMAAAVQLSPTQWWVTGGYDGGQFLSSTEIYTVGSGWKMDVNLPVGMDTHGLVYINATNIMLVAGYTGSPATTFPAWMYNPVTKAWRKLPNLLASTIGSQAGLVTYPNGDMAVVAAGGYPSTSTQIFSLRTQTWDWGTAFPAFPVRQLYDGVSVQYGNTFLVVGGFNNGDVQDAIYMFNVNDGSWVTLPQRLATPRLLPAAVLVPDQVPTQCSRNLTKAKELEIRSVLKTFINPFNNGTVQIAQAIRLAFHDCVGGCNGCLNVLDPGNKGRFTATFDSLNSLYTTSGYGAYLSRADFYALAAIVAIEQGIQIANVGCTKNCIPMHTIAFKYCRQDCPTSPTTGSFDGLPDGMINHTQTTNFFSSAFGLNERLATALLGVHTVGFCGGNTSSGFAGSWKGGADANNVKLNTKFDNGYFQNLVRTDLTWTQMNTQDPGSALGPKWQWFGKFANGTQASFMLNTDMSLLKEITTDNVGKSACTFGTCKAASTATYVNQFASNATAWMADFSTAFQQMIATGSSALFTSQ